MQITQIRVAGFKSFVDPTDIPIEEGLTGIVGPNGCGKSNLLEALRWAMGASSARAMRGSEMDDLIFSGSQARPARETAEVTLVLDNSDRKAPAGFNASDTLEILRRLKRGVGSTYKLNGRTVRGKDIQLLFADASTGANSPALVRQGQISELIASKPQNRRRILEEAAGIAGLNTRRHEAELKLRAAETNLERLTELTSEVERQLESLKRQARKARKYKALSLEISGLEALAAHLRWADAKAASLQAGTALGTAKAAVEQLTRQDSVAETARIKAVEALNPLREAESLASAKLGQARISLARLEAEHKAAADAAARMEGELDRLLSDLERENAMIEEAEAAIARAQTELANLPKEDAGASNAQEIDARNALDIAREELRAHEASADQLNAQLAQARATIHAAKESAERQTLREASLRTEAARLLADLEATGDTDDLTRVLAEAQSQEATADKAVLDADAALETAEANLASCAKNEAQANAPVSDLDQAVRTLESEIGGLERLLRKTETSKAPPVLDSVSISDGYERAVAAALGDDLQASTDTSAPLYWASAITQADTPKPSLPDGARPLGEIADVPAELNARLGMCAIVDAEDGPRLARQLAPGQRLVSREGHLWRWDGFVRTAKAPISAAEHLEQKARLKSARQELIKLRADLDTAREKLDTAEAAKAEAEQNIKTARATTLIASKALNAARLVTAKAKQVTDHAHMKREAAQTALVRVEADLRHVTQALELAKQDSAADNTAALAADLLAAREHLAKRRENEVEARGRLTDLTRGREQAIARREALSRDMAEWRRRAEAASARRDGLIKRREETAASLAAARGGSGNAEPGPNDAITAQTDTVERLEAARKAAADRLAQAQIEAHTAAQAARAANSAAAKSRESLAGASVLLETKEAQFSEIIEIAKNQFQRAPEGLLTLAQATLSQEEIEGATYAGTSQKADFLKRDRDQLGGVNMEAESEAEEMAARLGTQASEKKDLVQAIAILRKGVDALNNEGRDRLLEAFETVNTHFQALFTALFRGGQAELRLIDAEDPLAAGLEIFAQPPGKRLGTLRLMSGGEQALTAAALIFAVFLSNPAPICVLDEVDAPLDDANVDRFCRMLDEMRTRTNTRFVVITHNPVTMSRMDRLFGVTMREKGVSKLVSVDLRAAEELVAAE